MSSEGFAFFDSEKLISEIKNRPSLYDKKLADFSNKAIREYLWSEVCEAIVKDWGQMDAEEKMKTGKND